MIGLVATPFVAAVSQASTTVSAAGLCATADAHRSPTSWSNVQISGARTGCAPVPPAPIDPPTPPPPTGGVVITGKVYNANSGSGLSGWTVEVSGQAAATVVSDGAGTYTFTGLPAGIYLVCEVLQVGWRQTVPSLGSTCPTGIGYRFTLTEGQRASFVNFGNVPN
jgi:hypothetical protein